MTKKTKIVLMILGGATVITAAYFGIRSLLIKSHYETVVTEEKAIDIIDTKADEINEEDIDYKELGVDTENETKTGVTLNDDEEYGNNVNNFWINE